MVVGRVRDLEQRTKVLRQQAGSNGSQNDDDTLWMSSLDIIGELLSMVEELVGESENVGDKMQLACPNCRSVVAVSYDAVADAAVDCPACGATMLLTNPT